MTLHKEGHKFLIKTLALVIACVVGAVKFLESGSVLQILCIAVPVFFLLIFVNFFRIPNKKLTKDDSLFICPCDGKVVVIEEVEETEYLKDRRKQVSIFMSPLNVHNNLNPMSGIVKYFKYHPGKYLMAFNPKSSTDNERTTVVVENSAGVQVLYRQIAGFLARRICWYVKEGDKVEQSEEFGFIKFGSRIDIYMPLDAEVVVELGQVTKGGQTVLAKLPA